jgi:hypothetical protein
MRNNYRGYTVIDFPDSGLMLTDSPGRGRQIWSLCKLKSRKDAPCAICGASVGDEAYRPVTNLDNRMDRICKDSHLGQMTATLAIEICASVLALVKLIRTKWGE